MKKLLALLVTLLLVGAGCSSKTAQTGANGQNQQLTELAVASAPGPVTYSLVAMTEQQGTTPTFKMALKPWKDYDQLIAMISAKQVHMATAPLTNSFMLYNKGMNIKLVNVSVWGMLYVITADDSIKSFSDLKGKTIAISGNKGLHDLVFRHLLIQSGINPDKDLTIQYMDLPESSAKLVTGEIKYAVLNEPNSSIAVMNGKKSGVELKRVIDLQKEWGVLTGGGRIPQAGLIMIVDSGIKPEMVKSFADSFSAGAQWVNNNPEQAGIMVEKQIPAMKAQAVQQSLQFAHLQPKSALEARAEVEAFFTELARTAPKEAIGGQLPDANFYFVP